MGILGEFIDGVIDGVGEFVDGFVDGINETSQQPAPVVSHAAVPVPQAQGRQGVMPVKVINSTPGVISSMEEMQAFLAELERNCVSTAITAKTAIQSQMLVINNIQSPTLVDTAFDTLILNLRKSLKAADDLEKEELREVYCLMIQNYVFFMDAKYQAKVKANREESRALLEQAGLQLSRSVGQVACLATGAPSGGVVIGNIFDEGAEQTTLWSKVVKWWNKAADTREAEDNFNKSLFAIIKKLDKYHEVIGPSMLIAGLIDRYKEQISLYEYQDAYSEAAAQVEEYTPGANASIFFTRPWATILTFILTSLLDVAVSIIIGIWQSDSFFSVYPVFPTKWVIGGLVVTAFVEFRSMLKAISERNSCRAVVKENMEKMDQINQEYNNTLQELERIQQYYEDVL